MLKELPRHCFLAEPLRGSSVSEFARREGEHVHRLTRIIFCKSLFEYVLMTFTATSRPQYSPFQTSAYPPLYNGKPFRS